MTVQEQTSIDPFQLALQKRQQAEKAQAEAKSSGGGWGEQEHRETVGLINEKEIVGRIIGNPIEVRSKPTDPKLILQSEVVKDDKKGYWKLNWPWKEQNGYINPDPDWIVTKFMKKVFDGKWTKYVEADIDGKDIKKVDGKIINTASKSKNKEGYWKHAHVNTEIYKLLKAGNSKEGELYPKDFEPGKRVVLNWLDRHDDWCSVNKHYKLLTAKKSPFVITKEDGTKDTIYFTDTGIPNSLYDMIIDHCKAVGTLDIDLVLIKDNRIQAKYKVWDITDTKYLTDPNTSVIGKKEKLTEEERAYEAYDLDKLYKVSTYFWVKKVLGSRMALCDAELGTTFVNQLNDLIEKEKAEWEANKVYWYHAESDCVGIATKEEWEKMCSGPATSQCDEISKERYEELKKSLESSESKPEIKEEPKQVESRRSTPITETPVESVSIEDQCKVIFEFWNNLSDTEKQLMVVSIIRFEGNVPIYKEQGHPGCLNQSCYYKETKQITLVPNGVNSCPVCGTNF